jgi:hypothetical protein
MSWDRGQNVPTERAYRQLAGKIFTNVNAWVNRKPMRIPYVTVVLECEQKVMVHAQAPFYLQLRSLIKLRLAWSECKRATPSTCRRAPGAEK